MTRWRLRVLPITVLLAMAFLSGGCGHHNDVPPAEISVSNSYLYAIVRDLCGDQTAVFCIVPPGMCPGHFDIKPSDAQRLFQSRLLLAFDFQQSIGKSLPQNGRGPAFHTVTAPPGLCIPQTYLSMTHHVADILMAHYPQRQAEFRERLVQIDRRIKELEAECAAAAESLNLLESPVLSSRHQAEFAKWLGLNVVSDFSGSDTETAANINTALRQSDSYGLRWIIANQQEGTQLAKAMAERLKTPVAVFSNFPNTAGCSVNYPAFDELVRSNIRQLTEAPK